MNFLGEIVRKKGDEARLRRSFTEPEYPLFKKRRSLEGALGEKGLSYVFEVKKASPSGGLLSKADVAETAKRYQALGADAVSVLTDGEYFGGSLTDLVRVKQVVDLPVLRKDFIVNKDQIRESLYYGADAVLLIAAILKERTPEFVEYAGYVGVECVVEAHDGKDLGYALKSDARLIGVNNRSLKTLKTDLKTFEKMAPLIPDDRLKIAESGLKTRADVKRMREAGADAVLIGSAIMKSDDPGRKIKELMG